MVEVIQVLGCAFGFVVLLMGFALFVVYMINKISRMRGCSK